MKNLRNIHLLEAAQQMAASGKSAKIMRIARSVVVSPAPFYYVEYNRAVHYMHLFQRNALPANLTSVKRNMWLEIFSRVNELCRRNPQLTSEMAVQKVLCQGNASSFFMHPVTAARILRRNRQLFTNMQTDIAI